MEEHNLYIDQLADGQLRRAILAAARWLVSGGALATADDVFWLQIDEIITALRTETPLSFTATLAARQAQHAEWARMEPPSLLGTPEASLEARPPFTDAVTTASTSLDPSRLTGQGASAGRRRGRARVIPNGVLLPNLSPGEVLVAENAGPLWTPIFPMLGGVVLDQGAVAQHAAAAAREYGVPAVFGTQNATRHIQDGTWVIVDGTAGVVEVESE